MCQNFVRGGGEKCSGGAKFFFAHFALQKTIRHGIFCSYLFIFPHLNHLLFHFQWLISSNYYFSRNTQSIYHFYHKIPTSEPPPILLLAAYLVKLLLFRNTQNSQISTISYFIFSGLFCHIITFPKYLGQINAIMEY